MNDIRDQHIAIDNIIASINSKTVFFIQVKFFDEFIKNVSFNSFEICFKDSIWWLNILYVESCGSNLSFVQRKVKDFGVYVDKRTENIPILIHAFRTVWGHLMSSENTDDMTKIKFCEGWFTEVIGKIFPESEDEWKTCTKEILSLCINFLNSIEDGLDMMISDNFADIITEDWKRVISRNFSKHDWELVLIDALNDFGMNHFDSLVIVNKNLDKWRTSLSLLKDGFKFRVEARRIVESYFGEKDLWPASSQDLIDLGVPKGPELGAMVKKAKELYHASPCNKDELLRRFREKYM